MSALLNLLAWGRAGNVPPMPNIVYGGTGQYMFWLVLNNYTTSVPTAQSVVVTDALDSDNTVATIPLTANKNYSSIHYCAVDQTVHVAGADWITVIDANPASGTFLDIIEDETLTWASCTPNIMSYLPYPLDFFTTGGTSRARLGGPALPQMSADIGNLSPADIRLGGHSNFPNSCYYHESNLIYTNRNLIRCVGQSGNLANKDYSMYGYSGGGVFNDLNGTHSFSIRFGNFQVLVTSNSAYLMSLDNIATQIMQEPWPTLATSSRVYQEYAPNAEKLFFSNQISNNNISVIGFNKVNHLLTDLGDIDRTPYKATNENGAAGIIYNPANGFIYVMANNNLNVTGVDKVHVYDPTQATASMYVRTITIGEFKSDARVSIQSFNNACINRTRIFEFTDVIL